ncbi:alpha-xenorhabdolysin family binary toxin subunit A [Pseudomonas alliivorans]|uniref:Alpha-xenorhabdolysin family binary toxin subunit A n=1 Tax=Pseudomonas alliivorans TaxID=2810613 RepID=A0ABS4CB04_9PSED|nr:alpha-xenorhabdolysin family binary toxin subunit A [Pseudomonas alliivorans]MBP0947703.1 alpha-xenorhabdolysin family binary toxin subunit A [Pseudomonas alliivorans]MEE4328242.1 alpha-xenorhabdolysin family binary toxin subunit A [Pseudomonas alliivorans]MEE4336162.1 alpha-xenorhabdolysin family binary toxin subunit A [Pseudomonas alliivorans]MEE4369611.1 alpha-xenorhabdolysin family binary toxin subunit A [Pseudomonas alliivorans]MEE4914446.1 alpha-xenorhabdolysin family binary toxin sub
MHDPKSKSEVPEKPKLTITPTEFLRALVEDEKNNGRATALILTKEDILSIKRYERHSLNLPNTLERVKQQLGFAHSGISGLEPQDLLLTYRAINQHAQSWSAIEVDIKAKGFDLDLFAGEFSNQGKQILDYVDKMELARQLQLTVDDLTIETVRSLSPAPLTKTDKTVCLSLAEMLKKIAVQMEAHRKASKKLAKDIKQFAHTLTVDLVPVINDKVALANRSDLDEDLIALEKEIDRLTVDIDQKHQEYSTTRTHITLGLLGGLVGLIVTDSIFGAQAEAIRKEKNRLIKEKKARLEMLGQKRPLAAAIRNLEILFEDMKIRMLDAHQSAVNLQDLWTMLAKYVDNAATRLADISDDQTLLDFVLEFKSVVTPWEEIKGITTHLLLTFEQALDEFSNQQSK